jgi:hypothetical protein
MRLEGLNQLRYNNNTNLLLLLVVVVVVIIPLSIRGEESKIYIYICNGYAIMRRERIIYIFAHIHVAYN